MMMDDMTIAIWLTIPPERMQELCPGKIFLSDCHFQKSY